MSKHFSLADAPDQTGRIAIVTGANTGLGYETALALAGKGAKVILACRNRDKAEEAKASIAKSVPSAKLEVRLIDTGSQKSVREFAAAYIRDHERLDLLINNAGIMITPYFATEDNFEGQFAVNFLGHFTLTALLLPLLNKTPKARIVSLYSLAASWGDIQFDDIHFKKKYDATKSYSQSKLACLMFAQELNQRLVAAGHDTRALAAHPGFSQSDLSRNLAAPIRFGLSIIGRFIMQSAAAGAMPTLYAALGEDLRGGEAIGPAGLKEMKGPATVVQVRAEAQDETQRGRLWSLAEEFCGIRYPL
ncbi:oxidoreductase [Zhongshania sp.]|uniref:oxidoreductase n=1 Tax=Zhongshania sp. TaxID=1971902 RepID=UPI0035664BAB